MGTAKSSPGEFHVSGAEMSLPLVEGLSAVRSHSASRITWHRHTRFELLFLLEGATAYEFPEGRSVALPGGHFLVVPPGTMHRGVQNVRMPASLCGIVFDPRLPGAQRHSPFTRQDLAWMRREFERHPPAARRMGPELRKLSASLSRELGAGGGMEGGRVLSLRVLVCAALLEAARQRTGARTGPPANPVAAAIARMEQHFSEPLPMTELAGAAGCGRARWFQLCKQSTGMTPNDYLQRLRINKACDSLTRFPGRSVTEIAHGSGFSSSQYFSNVFRKYTGTTPTALRTEAVSGKTRSTPERKT